MAADIAISIGLDLSEAVKGRDQLLALNTSIASSLDGLVNKAKASSQGLGGSFTSSMATGKKALDDYDKASAAVMAGEVRRSQQMAKAAQDQESAAKRLLSSYAPLAAESERLARDQETLNNLISQGGPKVQQYQTALANLQTRQAAVSKEMERGATSTRMSANQLQNLSYQLNDVVSGLAMGQPPMQILAQQGGQIVQVFQGAGVAVLGYAAAVAAIAAPAVLTTIRVIELNNQLRDLKTNLQLSGRASALSGMVREDVINASAMSGTSRAEAMDAAAVIAKNSQIRTAAMAETLKLTTALADVTGGKAADAADTFSKAIDGGYEGLVKFNLAYRTLEPAQMDSIRALYEQGKATDAAGLAINLMGERLQKLADERLTPTDKLLRSIANGFNQALDAASRPWRTPTLQDRRDILMDQIASAKWNKDNSRVPGLEKELALVNSQIEAEKALGAEMDRIRAIQDQRGRNEKAQRAADIERDVGYLPKNLRSQVGAFLTQQNANINSPGNAVDPNIAMGQVIEGQKTQARDAADAINIQADAAARLAAATNKGVLAQQEAVRQNTIQQALYENAQTDVNALTEALKRQDAAKLSGIRIAYDDQTRRETIQANALAEAWRSGDAEAIRRASIINETITLSRELGISEKEATARIESRAKAASSSEVSKGIFLLQEQVNLAQKLANLEGRGDVSGARQAQVAQSLEAFRRSNPYASPSDMEAQRKLLEAQASAPDIRSAYGIRNEDPSVKKAQSEAELKRLSMVRDEEGRLILTEEDIARRRAAINEEYINGEISKLEASRNWADGAEAALRRYVNNAQNAGARAGQFVASGMRSAEDALVDFSMGTKTAGEAFRDFASSVVRDLIRMQMQAAMAQAVGAAGGGGGGLFGLIGSAFSVGMSYFGGGGGYQSAGNAAAISSGDYTSSASSFSGAFASGTDYAPPGMALVGENGPELMQMRGGERIYPNDQTKAILSPKATNDNAGSGGGSINFAVSVDARGSTDPAAVENAARRASEEVFAKHAPSLIERASNRALSKNGELMMRGGRYARAVRGGNAS